ncbi:MAG: NlpC/P60 family protein [Marinifilaceae bacterium]
MEFGISDLSIIPVRREPAEKSEMVTQILFGEHFKILEEKESWAQVELAFDGYQGWVDKKMLRPISEDTYQQLEKEDLVVASDTFNLVFQEHCYSNKLIVPGSSLPFCEPENKSFRIEGKEYSFQGKVSLVNSEKGDRDSIIESALKYFNAPYLWGGRTPYGIDCSGLTQIVYKLNGYRIPRDASQQVAIGESLTFVEEAQPGDLAFFDNDEGRITHVGIIWDRHKIIHASGKVRIDNVDHQGIFNVDTKQYTHKLRVIKRMI